MSKRIKRIPMSTDGRIMYMANPVRIAMASMLAGKLGMIVTPKQGNRLPHGVTWCADNGCGPGKNGEPGAAYPGDDAFLGFLAKLADRQADCLFAVAPDVLGDAQATLTRSIPMMPKMRAMGYRVALVAQDGLENIIDQIPWSEFDVLFIGGSTEWKLGYTVRRLIRLARMHGKRIHMGRVNSYKRLTYAYSIGCDTADGTYAVIKPSYCVPKLLEWVETCRHRVPLHKLSRKEILKATAEYDTLGRDAFLTKYGYGKARSYMLKIGGKLYDSKAIVGAAYGYQLNRAPLAPADFTGGAASVGSLLSRLGFALAA